MLRIHNSLTGRKQDFVPIRPGQVRMYVCGMTVYDYIHLGHARMLTVFDLVQRYLRYAGFAVTYVRNITDIDDKIIARAAQNGERWDALAQRYIDAMDEDCARLGLARPDIEPRATHYIDEIIRLTQLLLAKGMAYVAPDGEVLYSVRRFPGYGTLSGKNIEDLRAGARVQVDEDKQDPLDFVLWKPSKPGEPAWQSPWGPGRPGWHIECSAMSMKVLGEHFDIHGGGMDLKFPHHENEIAQSCGACDTPFVNLWMHNGFVRVNDEKMSKSLHNFFTVREVLPTLRDPEVMRLFLLSSHYRGPINYSLAQLQQADETLLGLYRALQGVPTQGAPLAQVVARFREAMDDDFNTPEALAALQAAVRELNAAKSAGRATEAAALAATLRSLGAVLGLLQQDPDAYLKRGAEPAGMPDAQIEALLEERRTARKARDFARGDAIRDELKSAGILIEDRPDGQTRWRRA